MKNKEENTKKVVSWHTYKPSQPEYNSGEIVVIPDQAFTIEEILDKFTRGIDLSQLYRDGRYSNSDDIDEVDHSRNVNDPYDIDDEVVESIPKFRRKKPDVKTSGLPEDGGAQIPPEDDGVKDDKTKG